MNSNVLNVIFCKYFLLISILSRLETVHFDCSADFCCDLPTCWCCSVSCGRSGSSFFTPLAPILRTTHHSTSHSSMSRGVWCVLFGRFAPVDLSVKGSGACPSLSRYPGVARAWRSQGGPEGRAKPVRAEARFSEAEWERSDLRSVLCCCVCLVWGPLGPTRGTWGVGLWPTP